MAPINFQPIFDYIDQSINPLKEEIAELRDDVRLIKSTVAQILTDMKDYETDMLAGNYRTKRLENWAEPAGKKIDLPFVF